MNCLCCGQPMPITCLKCDGISHFVKSKKSATGMNYQVRECDLGHRFVVTPDGRKAWRYSGKLENDHVAIPAKIVGKQPTHSADAPIYRITELGMRRLRDK